MSSSVEQPTATRYTDEQRSAIEMRNNSVAISAGAGCGKTFVLTERFLAALLPDPQNASSGSQLHQLVAITFTERAAREMRDRVREKLYERQAAASSPEAAANWQTLIRDLDAARISTFHSFCTSLLRSHAVEARLDPQFTVLDQAEANTLLSEVIDDRLRELLATQDANVMELVYFFQIQGLRQRVQELAGAAPRSELERWQEKSVDEIVDAWSTFHKEHVLPAALRSICESEEAVRVRQLLSNDAEQTEKVLAVRGTLEDLLGNLTKSGNPAGDLHEIHEAAKVAKVGSKKAFSDEDVYEDYKNTCERLRKRIKSQGAIVDFDEEAARPMAELGQRLLAVTLDIREQYEQRKKAAAQLEFDDLMQYAHQLLAGPGGEALCRQVGSQIDLLMVDEFQDTDPIQDSLVRLLCGDDLTTGKLFFVGDFKQSIYKFRGARPDVFRKLQEDTSVEGRLPLSRNFRSQPAILDFVNALFYDAFQDYFPLRAHRAQVADQPSIEFLWTPAESKKEKGGARRGREQEADWIARRIRALIDEETPLVYVDDDSPPRPARPGDVALLFRTLSDVDLYEQALRTYGLDYYLVGGHAFYAQQEVFDLVNLLRSLASTCDAVSLAGVLRSPFFGLTDATLFWLAQDKQGLYAGLFAETPAGEIAEDQQRQVRFAAETLRYLSERKDRLPVADLIGEAIARTGYDAVLLTEFMGERKLANLHKLIQMARNFDRVSEFGLPEFITQLTEFVVRQPKESPAATQAENTDVVRLMTIHQAKGLEFPVVFVPDMNRKEPGSRESVAFNPQLGVLVQLPSDRRTGSSVSGLDLHRKADAVAEEEERDRLLYVAATRAADYLVLSSSVPDLAKPDSSWLKRLAGRFDFASGEVLDELPEEYTEPQILVTRDSPELKRSHKATDNRRQLKTLCADTEKMIQESAGDASIQIPTQAKVLAPREDERREFSFSRLSGQLVSATAVDELGNNGTPGTETSNGDRPGVGPSDGALLGTLVHDVLGETLTGTQLGDVVARHADELAIPDGPLREEATALVTSFLASDRAAQIAAATEVHREIEFLLAWPPNGSQGARSQSESLRIRGFIDCLYRDSAGNWHVADYKTNRTTADRVSEVAAAYEMQMLLYGLAAEQALGVAPASLTLCFLRPGVEIPVSYDDDSKRRLVEFVDRAIGVTGATRGS